MNWGGLLHWRWLLYRGGIFWGERNVRSRCERGFDRAALLRCRIRRSARLAGWQRRAAYNVLLNDHIGRPANKDKVFYVVPADQKKTAAAVDCGAVHQGNAWLTATGLLSVCSHQALDNEYEQSEQDQDDGERNHQCQPLGKAFADLKCGLNPIVHLIPLPPLIRTCWRTG